MIKCDHFHNVCAHIFLFLKILIGRVGKDLNNVLNVNFISYNAIVVPKLQIV
jgi:hypothetical protein